MPKRKTTASTEQEKKNDANAVKQEVYIEFSSASSHKRTRQSVGVVHQKNLCIWRMKGDDLSKHPKQDKFYNICEDKFWKKFKASIMYLQDAELKLRLQKYINYIPDPFSTKIWGHDSCRKRYIRPIYSTDVNEICKM